MEGYPRMLHAHGTGEPAPLPETRMSGRRGPRSGKGIQGSGPLVRHLVS